MEEGNARGIFFSRNAVNDLLAFNNLNAPEGFQVKDIIIRSVGFY